jgi:hypothetical protein
LTETLKELDTSGGKALNQRRKLSHALAAVEAGRAEAIVLAYRDRMDSSITTGSELCERMDATIPCPSRVAGRNGAWTAGSGAVIHLRD